MTTTTTSQSSFPLPDDITVKILDLLPFESILDCKRVSKEWKSLINNPKFYKHYRDKSITFFISEHKLYCVLMRHNKERGQLPFTVHNIPVNGPPPRSVSCPSNHLVALIECFTTHLLLYNLITGVFHTLQDPPHMKGFIGFGYDRYHDDYKILMGDYFIYPTKEDGNNGVFWVYSNNERVWKQCKGFPCDYIRLKYPRIAFYLNGLLHWVVDSTTRIGEYTILTYDLHTSRFGEIDSFPRETEDNISLENLMEVSGHLCYVSSCYDRSKCMWMTTMWVMKGSSWTRLFGPEKSGIMNYYGSLYRMKPIVLYECQDRNTFVLFHRRKDLDNEAELLWCDIDNDKMEVVDHNWLKKTQSKDSSHLSRSNLLMQDHLLCPREMNSSDDDHMESTTIPRETHVKLLRTVKRRSGGRCLSFSCMAFSIIVVMLILVLVSLLIEH